jgi:DNA-binding response OmpR family regulator
MKRHRVLLVDDDDNDIFLTQKLLEENNCEVISARSVNEAFKQIAMQSFDILITDLHMPDAGDGFAVVTAMRHSQPEALTLVVSGFPDVQRSMEAIVLQADEVLVKPFDLKKLTELIARRTPTSRPSPKSGKESVASILDRDVAITMQRWLSRVEQVKELTRLPVSPKERTEYLPEIMRNITAHLRAMRDLQLVNTPSPAAVAHGQLRYRQGYTAPLIVLESRILQVSIFETVHRNLATVDFASVLPDVMIVADEVDCQLTQSIDSFLTMQRREGPLAPSARDFNDSHSGRINHSELFFDPLPVYKA